MTESSGPVPFQMYNVYRRVFTALLVGTCVSTALNANAQQVVDDWHYTFSKPQSGWRQADFDDSAWQEGPGGFGSRDTPGARIGSHWRTSDIWLRKSFTLDSIPANPGVLIHHDDDAQVFINGRRVAKLQGYSMRYKTLPIAAGDRSALRVGENILAVHCRQTEGGQFIDAHLVDAESVPQLPPPKPRRTPFKSALISEWGERVTPDNLWAEYPRPQMKRKDWQNLNGHWDYAITPDAQSRPPKAWAGKILVPFCLESRLGGVQRLLAANEALWYRRTFDAQADHALRTLLNFEAVDYRCEVLVNGKSVGKHQGGNTPFALDITDAVRDGANELIVRVEDDTQDWQLCGKQRREPEGIWYTRVSGIWQTVWLEQVPPTHITAVKTSTEASTGRLTVRPVSDKPGDLARVRVVVSDHGKQVADVTGTGDQVEIVLEDPKLWSPDSPHLYDLRVSIQTADGKTLDTVDSYVGIRSVGKTQDADGHWRFTLNGKQIFHWGPLDQGWWPDGLLTPPSDEAMAFDVQWLKQAGFNMIRKHIKVEPRRFYYHCDRLGMMVWQDHVSGGKGASWTRLQPDPKDAEWPDNEHQQFMLELERMIYGLESHPSIVAWVPFNEAWGQHRTVEVGEWTTDRDRSRLVNVASGGNFWPAGDVVDAHAYPHPDFPFQQGKGGRFKGFIKVMGEFGGHGFPVRNHLWDASRRNWGYGGLPKNKAEYKQRYVESLDRLNDLRGQGIAAGVYTQTTDVEGEINGLMTYDRRVIKIPADELAELHKRLFAPLDAAGDSPPNAR